MAKRKAKSNVPAWLLLVTIVIFGFHFIGAYDLKELGHDAGVLIGVIDEDETIVP